MRVLHKSSSALKKFLMELPSVLSWNGREYIKTMDIGDGAFSKAVFIASEGHEFKLATRLVDAGNNFKKSWHSLSRKGY